jgi:hypothetical protein
MPAFASIVSIIYCFRVLTYIKVYLHVTSIGTTSFPVPKKLKTTMLIQRRKDSQTAFLSLVSSL